MDTTIQVRNKLSRGRGRYGEARLARKVNGVVCGRSKAVKLPSGKWLQINCQRPPDVVTDLFSFESKWLKAVPVSLDKIMTQAVKNAPVGLVPVGVIGDRQAHTVYYIMNEHDWLDLHVGEEQDLKEYTEEMKKTPRTTYKKEEVS